MSTGLLRLQKLARCEVIQRLVRAFIVVEAVAAMPLPLPPPAEQHRIVAKVDALMALCDRLEASLATGDDTRRRLLDALLAEALSLAETPAMEAVA